MEIKMRCGVAEYQDTKTYYAFIELNGKLFRTTKVYVSEEEAHAVMMRWVKEVDERMGVESTLVQLMHNGMDCA